MTCPSLEQISALHDGELSQPAADAVARHVADCPRCQAELAALRHLSRQVAAVDIVEPTPVRMQRWLKAVRQAESERAALRLANWLTAAAAVVLISALPWLAQTPTQASPGVGEAELLLLTRGELRGEEMTPRSLAIAQWIALDLGTSAADDREGQP